MCALPLSGILGIKSGAGVSLDRSISWEVDGSETGNKDLVGLAQRAGLPLPVSMSDFYGYSSGPTEVPGEPTNVQAVDAGPGIDIGWQAPLDGGEVDYYWVEKSVEGGPFTLWNSVVFGFSVQDTDVNTGNIYQYKVYAANALGDSAGVTSNFVTKS